MRGVQKWVRIAPIALLAFAVGVPLYGLPATLSLPRGQRPDVDRLTLSQAARQLQDSGQTGWALVEAARAGRAAHAVQPAQQLRQRG